MRKNRFWPGFLTVFIAFVVDRLAKPILDVTIQDFWKEIAQPFLKQYVGSWIPAVIDWIGPYWLGVASTLLVWSIFELVATWRRGKYANADRDQLNVPTSSQIGTLSLHGLDNGRIWTFSFEAAADLRDVVFRVEWRSMLSNSPRFSDWQKKTLATRTFVAKAEIENVTLTSRYYSSNSDEIYIWNLHYQQSESVQYEVPSTFCQAKIVVLSQLNGADQEVVLKFIILDRFESGASPQLIRESLFNFSGEEPPDIIY